MWAKSEAPIILWIDEIDLLDLQRVGDKKTLMAFLTGMGNSFDNDPNKLVIIIGCTNRPQNMDFALKQYGRFGKEIRFEYPSAEYRRKFIIKQLQSMGQDPRYFDIEALTYKTEGCHFEQIKAFIKGASVKAWMYGKVIDQDLLDECFDTEIRHILPVERKVLSDTEREVLATHFAGKALAHALLDTRGQLDRVTIRPIMVKLEETWVYEELTDKEKQAKGDEHKIQYGQVFTKYLNDTAKINTYEQALNEIKILVAGFAAEEVMFGVSTYSCHPEDSMIAYKAAEALAFEGLDRARIGKKQLEKLTEKSYLLKKQCHEEVKKLLEEYKFALEALIKALKNDATLSDNQVMAIIEQAMAEQEEKEAERADTAFENSKEVVVDVRTSPFKI
jgi:cell division protease FtsH